MEKGAEIEAEDKCGRRALMLAAMNGQKEVCELLIEKGANVTGTQGVVLLQLAICTGNTEIRDLLIEKGATLQSAS
ncbi:MAG TPA: hypothetical protein DEP20_03100 [Fusobacteria bacterium]|nr:hypothetical protein [Fusobacteriota bacterium]